MSQCHRHWPRPIAVDHRKIGMTQACGTDPDQDFASARLSELDRLHHQWLGYSKRRLRANGVQYGGPDFHDDSPAPM